MTGFLCMFRPLEPHASGLQHSCCQPNAVKCCTPKVIDRGPVTFTHWPQLQQYFPYVSYCGLDWHEMCKAEWNPGADPPSAVISCPFCPLQGVIGKCQWDFQGHTKEATFTCGLFQYYCGTLQPVVSFSSTVEPCNCEACGCASVALIQHDLSLIW